MHDFRHCLHPRQHASSTDGMHSCSPKWRVPPLQRRSARANSFLANSDPIHSSQTSTLNLFLRSGFKINLIKPRFVFIEINLSVIRYLIKISRVLRGVTRNLRYRKWLSYSGRVRRVRCPWEREVAKEFRGANRPSILKPIYQQQNLCLSRERLRKMFLNRGSSPSTANCYQLHASKLRTTFEALSRCISAKL